MAPPRRCHNCHYWQTLLGVRRDVPVCKCNRSEFWMTSTGPNETCEEHWYKEG